MNSGLFKQLLNKVGLKWLFAVSGILPLLMVLWLSSFSTVEFATLLPILAQFRVVVFFLAWLVTGLAVAVVKKSKPTCSLKQTLTVVMSMSVIIDVCLLVVSQIPMLVAGALLLAHHTPFDWLSYWQMLFGLLPLVISGQSIYAAFAIHYKTVHAPGWWTLLFTVGPALIVAMGVLMFNWPSMLRLGFIFSLMSAAHWTSWELVTVCWLTSLVTLLIALGLSLRWSPVHKEDKYEEKNRS